MISTLSRLSMPPWPIWSAQSVRTLRAMLGELEGLPITGGESSVRLSPAGLDCGRCLAALLQVGSRKACRLSVARRPGRQSGIRGGENMPALGIGCFSPFGDA